MKDFSITFNDDISAEEYIELMYENTDNGVLYIPGWYSLTEKEHSLRCKLNFGYRDCEKAKKDCSTLLYQLEQISKEYKRIESIKNAQLNFDDKDILNCWQTYIRPFSVGEFDKEQVANIEDRLETLAIVKDISSRISSDEFVSKEDHAFIKENLGVSVTDEEKKLFRKYVDAQYSDAENRVGDNICAYELIIRAMRVCKLMAVNAPAVVLRNEQRTLAASLVMHYYGKSIEMVSDAERLEVEKYFDGDETDEDYRPQKMNSRKSIAVLFVYFILKNHSSEKKPLRQKEILELLAERPYEISLERKALSRIIHNLGDSNIGLKRNSDGIWLIKNL